jgi:WD40 repeat protein
VLDIRSPTRPCVELSGHTTPANELAWSPRAPLLASAGDDRMVFVWNLATRAVQDAELQYQADGPVSAVQWSRLQPSWVAIGSGRRVQMLRV